MSFPFTKVLIHIGRPDLSKPHSDMSVLRKFAEAFPDTAIVIIVDNDEDQQVMERKIKDEMKFPRFHPGGLIISWKDDAEMMDLLCAELHMPIQWRVVGNGWYECKGCGHQQSPTLIEPITNCSKCKQPWEFIRHNEERVSQFREILKKSQALIHFDTRSGVVLEQSVNPTSNVMKNMPYALGTKKDPALRMSDFIGKGKGKAALCISAGPSLDDEIQNLVRLSKDCITIAVGRIYKKLRDAGVRVDYAFSCEMFDWDAAIFDDLGSVGDTIMCYPPVCAPATVQRWPGKLLCTWDLNTAFLLGEKFGMMGGNSVSHHLLNFAVEILGCEPAILVGQDLAYTKGDGRTHAKDSDAKNWPDEVKAQDTAAHSELTWAPCTGKGDRFNKDCHRQAMVVGGGAAKPLPVGSMEVLTSKPYINFGTLFEILIARHKKKVLNACGEGLLIAGTEYVDLSKWSP